MLGVSTAKSHLFPPLDSNRDIARLFGDSLEETKAEQRRQETSEKRKVDSLVAEVIVDPLDTARELTNLLQHYQANLANGNHDILSKE